MTHEMRRQLSFEELLFNISSKFITLPAEEIDKNIEDVQRQVCECLGFEVSILWQWSTTKPCYMNLTHLHSPQDYPERPVTLNAEEEFPWTYGRVMKGETVIIHTSKMPEEASRDRANRLLYGTKSSVAVPLREGGKPVIGAVSFVTRSKERTWPAKTVKRLELVAQIFCNALLRKANEEKHRESEIRQSLAMDIAGAGIWEYHPPNRALLDLREDQGDPRL